MHRTVKEIVFFKLNTLQGKVHYAQQRVDKLYESLESLPTDINFVNMALDNMLMSLDEFVANLDNVCPSLEESSQTHKKMTQGSTPHFPHTQISNKDEENADIVSRVNKLEEDLSAIRNTIHGDGGGEGSPHRGILSHLSVLENSFNEGTQQLISVEQKVQDVDSIGQKVKDMGVKYASVVDEMRAKTVKEDQQKEMENISINKRIQSLEVENVTLTKEFKNFEGKFEETMIDKQRLDTLEDTVKAISITSNDQSSKLESIALDCFKRLEVRVQKSVLDSESCEKKLAIVEEDLKTVKMAMATEEDLKKELEFKSLIEKFQKLNESFEVTMCDIDSYKDRLTCVEEQFKEVNLVSDGNRDEEVKRLKLEVANLDSLTKNEVLQRLSVLENRPFVAFKVRVLHNGPWTDGTVIRGVENVTFNIGNAFQKDQCRFLTPVDGIYCFILYLFAKDSNKTGVKLEIYDVSKDEWIGPYCTVTAEGQINGGGNRGVCLVRLCKGEAVRATALSGKAFERCILYGWSVSPTG